MSELKVYTQDEILYSSIGDDVYLQPDADKILAEKDKKIAEQKERYFELQDTAIKIDKELTETRKQLCHNKYERCLANAKYWIAVSYQCVDDKHRQRAQRHRRKWLELANKFNEAK